MKSAKSHILQLLLLSLFCFIVSVKALPGKSPAAPRLNDISIKADLPALDFSFFDLEEEEDDNEELVKINACFLALFAVTGKEFYLQRSCLYLSHVAFNHKNLFLLRAHRPALLGVFII